MNSISIGQAEAGQKLWRFLARRLSVPRAQIYRWLRSGELRVNSGRSKAERILRAGDSIRLPPQAVLLFRDGLVSRKTRDGGLCRLEQEALGGDLRLIHQDDAILALDKPAGLPVQDGSGQNSSVAGRLALACRDAFLFVPAPAHRLDKAASGLLLAGKTHRAQIYLHRLFREGKEELERDYLCWVKGRFSSLLPASPAGAGPAAAGWPSFILEDDIAGRGAEGRYTFLASRRLPGFGEVSLLRVRLLTGRKHQIRKQLSARGFPLVGDRRYGGQEFPRLLLHAAHIRVPAGDSLGQKIEELTLDSLPLWPPPFELAAETAEAGEPRA
ncbi:MAG: RluA family pseudouridine synthase [Deltaproteobacteria bacterium]|jgi:23S rRNA pseudouridine955/2504/2580 synthase|nr:RluA family pseudouridine synthase [Deltaproteobacteria bacterium]